MTIVKIIGANITTTLIQVTNNSVKLNILNKIALDRNSNLNIYKGEKSILRKNIFMHREEIVTTRKDLQHTIQIKTIFQYLQEVIIEEDSIKLTITIKLSMKDKINLVLYNNIDMRIRLRENTWDKMTEIHIERQEGHYIRIKHSI